MEHKTVHRENLIALRRAEGQVKGIQRMVEEKKYCIDIIIQIYAAIHALYRIGDKIFGKHIDHCVRDAFMGRSKKAKRDKIEEIMGVIKRMHKLG